MAPDYIYFKLLNRILSGDTDNTVTFFINFFLFVPYSLLFLTLLSTVGVNNRISVDDMMESKIIKRFSDRKDSPGRWTRR